MKATYTKRPANIDLSDTGVWLGCHCLGDATRYDDPCEECEGEGRILEDGHSHALIGVAEWDSISELCDECDGTGLLPHCRDCGDEGFVYVDIETEGF